MSFESQQENIDTSKKVISWLNAKAENQNLSRLLNIFLLGETLQESVAYVLTYQETIDSLILLNCQSFLRPQNNNILEILPPPQKESLATAADILQNELKIPNISFATKELYLETPRRGLKDYITFVLGE